MGKKLFAIPEGENSHVLAAILYMPGGIYPRSEADVRYSTWYSLTAEPVIRSHPQTNRTSNNDHPWSSYERRPKANKGENHKDLPPRLSPFSALADAATLLWTRPMHPNKKPPGIP